MAKRDDFEGTTFDILTVVSFLGNEPDDARGYVAALSTVERKKLDWALSGALEFLESIGQELDRAAGLRSSNGRCK